MLPIINYLFIKNKILNTENYLLNSISLSTIHSAKGLEWDKVYLIGMNQSYFPNPRSNIEEERRLFYVAVTRSKYNLVITSSNNLSIFSLVFADMKYTGRTYCNSSKVS